MEDHGGGGHIYGVPRAHLLRTMAGEGLPMGYPEFICIGPWLGRAYLWDP